MTLQNCSTVAARRGREPIGLYRGRSKRALVRIVPDGVLYRIVWPDRGPSDLCNLTRANAAALEWAQTKLPAAQRQSLGRR
jgi:hypothetical protein